MHRRLYAAVVTVFLLMNMIILSFNVKPVSGYNKGQAGTHYFIFDQANAILGNDDLASYQNFLNSYAQPGKTYLDKMKEGSDEADSSILASGDHYMSPLDHVGLYIWPTQFKSAASLCQQKFDEAVNHWVADTNYAEAMKDLGWAAHLIQDLCVPFHAAEDPGAIITNRHSEYENWVASYQNYFAVFSGGEYLFPSFPDRQYYPTRNSGPPTQAGWHYNGLNATAYDWADYNAHESLTYYLCVNYAAGTWNNFAVPCIETIHPLPNNLDTTWTITMNKSSGFQLHFSRIDMYPGDYIYIYDNNNNLLTSCTGVLNDVWLPSSSSFWYNSTDTLKIRVITGRDGTSWGYDIHDIKTKDIGDDLWGATSVLLSRAQRTTAGFIKFFFDWVRARTLKFDATGLDSSALGTIMTVAGVPVTTSQIPYYRLAAYRSIIDYSYYNVTSQTLGKNFVLTDVTGPVSPIVVTNSQNVTGNYTPQILNYTVLLGSRQENNTNINLGSMRFDNQSLLLPNNATEAVGTYLADYTPVLGNSFLRWETSGNVTVEYASSSQTSVHVLGTGALTAIYTYASEAAVPVGYWKFDESEGHLAYDSAGNRNDGTICGATRTNGTRGSALSFNGLNDYVEIPHDNTLVSSEFTIEAWIYLSSDVPNDQQRIVSKQESNARSYSLDIFGNEYSGSTHNQVALSVGNGSSWPFLLSTTKLSTGIWYHIAATHKGTTSRICINGILNAESTTSTQTIDNSAVLTIGCCAPSEENPTRHAFFNGTIDEVKIYNRALTQAQVYDEFRSTTYAVSLDSRQNTNASLHLGTIVLDGIEYSLSNSTTKASGAYFIQYMIPSGYIFDHWETTGAVSVTDPSAQSTSASLFGNGTITAVYKAPVINCTIALASREENGATTNLGLVRLENQTLELPSNVTRSSGTYLMEYNPAAGKRFLRWETSNNIIIGNASSTRTSVLLNGTGTIAIVYTQYASGGLEIVNVKAFYTLNSFFLGSMPDLVPLNQYFVKGNKISRVEFTVYLNGTEQTYTSLERDEDGWFNSSAFDMAAVTSDLYIVAYSTSGDSVSQIISTNVCPTPYWLQSPIVSGAVNKIVRILPSQPSTRFDHVWNISLAINWPEDPFDEVFEIPLPIIGGKYGINCTFGLKLNVQSDVGAVVGGGGGLQVYIVDAEAEVRVYVTGVIKIEDRTIRLHALTIQISGGVEIPIFKHNYSWNGIGVEVGVYVGGGVSCTLYLQEATSGSGTFGYGLDWVGTEAGISLWIGAYAQVGYWIGEVRIEGEGRVTFTFHVPPPYFTIPDDVKLEATITLTVKCWGVPIWQRDIFTYSSNSPVQWALNSTETGWIPREWANGNYSLYKWSGNTTEGTYLENVYTYADPSIDTSLNRTIMVWTHDDLSKPYIQGYEIYYATFDETGNWSLPAPITNDMIPEGDAVVKFDSDGNAVAVWTELNDTALNETIDPFSLLREVQLSYAVWSPTTNSWPQPKQITTDEVFHYSPTLVSDEAGRLMLVWMADTDGNLTTSSDESIYASLWNGTAWSAPTFVATTGILASPICGAYHEGRAALVWSEHTNEDQADVTDVEVFSSEFNGTDWKSPVRLTNNTLQDTDPSVTYWNEYPVYAWVQRVDNQSELMLLDYYGDNVSRLVLERPAISSPALKIDTKNRLYAFWTDSELPYSGALNSDGTISTAEIVTGSNNTENMYCGVYDCAAGMVDINRDGRVDMKDIATAAHAFVSTPSLPGWDPNADVNGDGKVDMKDIGSTAKEFQKAFSSRIGCRQITISR